MKTTKVLTLSALLALGYSVGQQLAFAGTPAEKAAEVQALEREAALKQAARANKAAEYNAINAEKAAERNAVVNAKNNERAAEEAAIMEKHEAQVKNLSAEQAAIQRLEQAKELQKAEEHHH